MKEVEKISEGSNYSAVRVGKMSELRKHRLVYSNDRVIEGKVVGKALNTTGAEMSFQYIAPGEGSAFLHSHKTHEELYIIVKGSGGMVKQIASR